MNHESPHLPPFQPDSGIRRATERRIDEELAQSFPASDPPSWTLGPAHPGNQGQGADSLHGREP